MVEFRYLSGAVYILENAQAQRVKIGMTTSSVVDRLNDANDKWLERKVTCQICGGRLVNSGGYVPHHVVSGIRCLGGGDQPLEKNVTLAEAYLENLRSQLSHPSPGVMRPDTRRINTLEKRIELYRHYQQPTGTWEIGIVFYTKCAEQVELLAHKILDERLDKLAPFGEVFCCSVTEAEEAVETVLSQLALLDSARKETVLRTAK